MENEITSLIAERRNAVTLIIIANYIIAVIHSGIHIPRKIVTYKYAWKKRKKKGTKRMTRSVFVTSSIDMKILSTSRLIDWRSDVCRIAVASFARNYALQRQGFMKSSVCRVHVLTMPHVMNINAEYVRLATLSIAVKGEPPVHLSISPIDDSTSRGLRYSSLHGQICEQSRRLYSISHLPYKIMRNIQKKIYNTWL